MGLMPCSSITAITTEENTVAYTGMFNPPTAGALLKEYLGEHTINELAEHIGVARATISRIIHGHTAVTAEMSVRLGQALNVSEEFFAKAQLRRDLWEQSQKKIPAIKPMHAA